MLRLVKPGAFKTTNKLLVQPERNIVGFYLKNYINLFRIKQSETLDEKEDRDRNRHYEENRREMEYALTSTSPDPEVSKPAVYSIGIMAVPYIVGIPLLYHSLLLNWDPIIFTSSTIARSLLKWTSLQLALQGGVHYGIAEIQHQIEPGNIEAPRVRLQLLYSFIPAAWAHYLTSSICYTPHITASLISSGFLALLSLQIATAGVDILCTRWQILPRWYSKIRLLALLIQVSATLWLFLAYTKYPERTNLQKDPNRIEKIPTAEELEEEDDQHLLEDLEDMEGVDLEEILAAPTNYKEMEIDLQGNIKQKAQ